MIEKNAVVQLCSTDLNFGRRQIFALEKLDGATARGKARS